MSNATESRRVESTQVLYEIEMFCALARYFETGEVDRAVRGLEREGLVVRNALIESFQVHARQLIEFLTRSTQDRSRASHFTWGPWKLQQTPAHKQRFDRFSERVMHLSLKRAMFTAREQRVETSRIRRELGAEIETFLDAVREDTVCDGFVTRAREALRASEPEPDVRAPSAVVGATESPFASQRGTATFSLDDQAYGRRR